MIWLLKERDRHTSKHRAIDLRLDSLERMKKRVEEKFEKNDKDHRWIQDTVTEIKIKVSESATNIKWLVDDAKRKNGTP